MVPQLKPENRWQCCLPAGRPYQQTEQTLFWPVTRTTFSCVPTYHLNWINLWIYKTVNFQNCVYLLVNSNPVHSKPFHASVNSNGDQNVIVELYGSAYLQFRVNIGQQPRNTYALDLSVHCNLENTSKSTVLNCAADVETFWSCGQSFKNCDKGSL